MILRKATSILSFRGPAMAAMCVSIRLISARAEGSKPVNFSREVLPILSENCFACHGPDETSRKAKLRLDKREGAMRIKDGVAVVMPGKSAQSEMIHRITSADPDEMMPPPKSNKKLTQDQIETLRRWIDQGAQWSKHWAYETPQHPALPAVKHAAWPKTPIDYFVLARLEHEQMEPSLEASKETLIRRVSLDLLGLPPTPKEVDAFLKDQSPEAYEKLVDRYLASPLYGERMAGEWLDKARFADSNGYQNDFHRSMWPWRDWVINAFNKNMPFDQFVIEQLAGDLLPNPTREQKVATGFNRNNHAVTEAGSIEEEWHVENTIDRIETTSEVFLGLTMGCARCHDHKFDPISQKEFYEFFAFFNALNEKGVYTETRGNVPPLISLPTGQQERKLNEMQLALKEAEKTVHTKESSLADEQVKWEAEQLAQPSPELPSNFQWRFALDGALGVEGAAVPPKYEGEGQPVWTDPLFGKALKLDGKNNSFVTAGDLADFDRTNAFSYGGWIKPKGAGAVLSRMDEGAAFRGFDLLLQDDRKVAVHLVHAWDTNAIKVITSGRLPGDTWSHVMVSYDGSGKAAGLHIYIDGKQAEVQVERDALTGSIATKQPLRLGRRSASAPFDGALRDIRIYNRALTQSEASALAFGSLRPLIARKAEERTPEFKQQLAHLYRKKFATDLLAAEETLAKDRKTKEDFEKEIPTVMIMEDMPKARETYILKRGQYDHPDKSEKIEPNVPAVLPPLPAGAPRNRLGLAQWLVEPENPLTARVAVSRYWERFFGTGLVKTSENFGIQGDPPSHPDLLDWLATEFIRERWNIKAIQKLIVMSATYRQSSAAAPEAIEKDPENQLLARGPRFRMSAETIRDNALAVSGLLVEQIGGPSIKPYQPPGLWEELAGGANEGPYKEDKGEGLYRRSLYIFRKRTVPPPTMATFDAPSREICQVKRQRTNTPLQALALLNDTTYIEASRKLAELMIERGGITPADRIAFGFCRATARKPGKNELEVLGNGLQRYLKEYRADPKAAKEFIHHGDSKPDSKLDVPELAAYTAVASVILNLDETITKE